MIFLSCCYSEVKQAENCFKKPFRTALQVLTRKVELVFKRLQLDKDIEKSKRNIASAT